MEEEPYLVGCLGRVELNLADLDVPCLPRAHLLGARNSVPVQQQHEGLEHTVYEVEEYVGSVGPGVQWTR